MRCEKCGQDIPNNLDYCPGCKMIEEQNASLGHEVRESNNLGGDLQREIQNLSTFQKQDSRIKIILKYVLSIDFMVLVLYGLLFLLPNILSRLENMSSWDILGWMFYGYIAVLFITIALSLVLTFKFIRKYFEKSDAGISFKIIIRSVSAYFLYLMILALLNLFLLLKKFNISGGSKILFLFPIFLPLLLIPISSFLNKDSKVNSKSVFVVGIVVTLIYVVQHFISLGMDGGDLANFISLDGGLLALIYQIASILQVPLVAIVPAITASLVNFKAVEDNDKILIKDVLFLLIMIFLYILVVWLIGRVYHV